MSFEDMVEEAFKDIKMSAEEDGTYIMLLNAPYHYKNSDEMKAYYEKHPKASLKELAEYWYSITPPGLAPDDDGTELEE